MSYCRQSRAPSKIDSVKQVIVLTVAAVAIASCERPEVREQRTGAQLFANHCAACHGIVGEGDGPVAAIMNTNVPNLRTLSTRSNGGFPADTVRAYIDGRTLPASHGDRQMPVWGDVFGWGDATERSSEQLAQQRIDAIVEHLRMIQF